jgi:hypothetical protein
MSESAPELTPESAVAEPEATPDHPEPPSTDEEFKANYQRVARELGLVEPEAPAEERAAEPAVTQQELDDLAERTGQRQWEREQAAHELAWQDEVVDLASGLAERAETADAYEQQAADEFEESTLDEAYAALDDFDPASAWLAADHVAANAPERLDEYLQNWYEQNPQEATRYASYLQQRQIEASMWQQNNEALAAQSRQQLEASLAQLAAQRQHQIATDAMVSSVGAEAERLRKIDPDFRRLEPLVAYLGGEAMRAAIDANGGFPLPPDQAEALIRSSYEGATALRQAEDEAGVDLHFDEQTWFQRQSRGEDLPPWNRAEALQRLTAERLRIRQPGAVVADKQAQRAGFRDTAALEREQRMLAEVAERNDRHARSLAESGAAAQRAKDASDEHFRRTGKRRIA